MNELVELFEIAPYGVSLLWISFLMMGVLDTYTFLYLILKRRQMCG